MELKPLRKTISPRLSIKDNRYFERRRTCVTD